MPYRCTWDDVLTLRFVGLSGLFFSLPRVMALLGSMRHVFNLIVCAEFWCPVDIYMY